MKNWKTTLVGFLFAVLNAFATNFFHASDGQFNRAGFFNSLGLLVIGFFAKDHDVTGGSRVQGED